MIWFLGCILVAYALPMWNFHGQPHQAEELQNPSTQFYIQTHQEAVDNGLPELPPSISIYPPAETYHQFPPIAYLPYGTSGSTSSEYSLQQSVGIPEYYPENYLDTSNLNNVPARAQESDHYGTHYASESNSLEPILSGLTYFQDRVIDGQGHSSFDPHQAPGSHGERSLSREKSPTRDVSSSERHRPPRLLRFQWQRELDISVLRHLYTVMYDAWGDTSRQTLVKIFDDLNEEFERNPEALKGVLEGKKNAINGMAMSTKRSMSRVRHRTTSKPWARKSFLDWIFETDSKIPVFASKNVTKEPNSTQQRKKNVRPNAESLPTMGDTDQERILQAMRLVTSYGIKDSSILAYLRLFSREELQPYFFRILGSQSEEANLAAEDLYTEAKRRDRVRKQQYRRNHLQQTYGDDNTMNDENLDWDTLHQWVYSPSQEDQQQDNP